MTFTFYGRIRKRRRPCWILLAVSAGIVLSISACLWCVPSAAAEQRQVSDAQLKAAFLFNAIKYVTWPPTVRSLKDIDVGILGRTSPGDALISLDGKIVNGKKLHVHTSTDLDDLIGCQVLYFSSLSRKQVVRSVAMLRNEPVLTISDSEDVSVTDGIMASITVRNGRLAFAFNLRKAHEADLSVSSNLLKLAAEVLK